MERRNLTFIDCRACRVEHYRDVAVVPTQRDLVAGPVYTSRMDNGDKRIQSNPEQGERGLAPPEKKENRQKCHRKSRRLSLKESQEKHASGTEREEGHVRLFAMLSRVGGGNQVAPTQ